MIFSEQSRWRFFEVMAVAVLLARVASPAWASDVANPKPTSKTGEPSAARNQAGDKEEGQSEEPPRASSRRTRAGTSGAPARAPLARVEQELVSDQKTIWTSPWHLLAPDSREKDKSWLVPLGVGTLGLARRIAISCGILEPPRLPTGTD
jgi:hypothetical protein